MGKKSRRQRLRPDGLDKKARIAAELEAETGAPPDQRRLEAQQEVKAAALARYQERLARADAGEPVPLVRLRAMRFGSGGMATSIRKRR